VTADTVFAVVFGAYGAAALVALLADAMDRGVLGSRVAAVLLFGGGALSLYSAWSAPPGFAYEIFVVGAGFSGVVGLVGVLAALTVAAAASSASHGAPVGQRTALVALSAVGAGIAAQAYDLVTLVIALEIAAACGYAIVASSRTRASSEAAMKYLLQGAVVTALLVVVLGIFVGGFQSAGDYAALAAISAGGARLPVLLGALLLVASLVFKSGGVPFHSWVPDAYQTSPPSGAAFLAGPVKLTMLASLAIVVMVIGSSGRSDSQPLGVLGATLFPVIGGLAILSILVGSLLALRQRSYTRMLAYAGVAQAGYALIAIASLDPSAAVMFTCTYALASTGAFLAAQVFASDDPAWDGSVEGLAGVARRRPVLGLSVTILMLSLAGIPPLRVARRRPVLGLSVTILMLSLAGIPPLLGFWGKLQAFQSAVVRALEMGQRSMGDAAIFYGVLAAAGIIGSIISVAYYGAVVRFLYAPSPDETVQPRPASILPESVVVLVAVAAFGLGLAPLFIDFLVAFRGFLLPL